MRYTWSKRTFDTCLLVIAILIIVVLAVVLLT
jgi:hypothetical protein